MPSSVAVSVNRIWIGVSMIPSQISALLSRPSLRMTCCMAKVRIRRLVQNGMVTRKTQTSRVCGGRVAMK
ncbi:hypothetical protein D3C87_2059440 [compost metagenome]